MRGGETGRGLGEKERTGGTGRGKAERRERERNGEGKRWVGRGREGGQRERGRGKGERQGEEIVKTKTVFSVFSSAATRELPFKSPALLYITCVHIEIDLSSTLCHRAEQASPSESRCHFAVRSFLLTQSWSRDGRSSTLVSTGR